MNLKSAKPSAVALAMVLFSLTSLAGPPSSGVLQPEQTVQKKVAFHVIGLMKTKSGAI
jgi:hypothetical protein